MGSWMRCAGNVRRTRILAMAAPGSAPSGDGGHDRDGIAILEGGLLALDEPDVFLVHVDVDEAPQLSAVVQHALPEPGELAFQVVHHLRDRLPLGADLGVALRDGAEWSRDTHSHRHRGSSWVPCDLSSASARSNAESVGRIFTWVSSRSYSASGGLSPLPVMQMTIDSSRGITPCSISFFVVATVTPPAVSVKIPSVRASSSMPSTISASVACSP